jgi:hypothetical protein
MPGSILLNECARPFASNIAITNKKNSNHSP